MQPPKHKHFELSLSFICAWALVVMKRDDSEKNLVQIK